jgi:hypothetical protein
MSEIISPTEFCVDFFKEIMQAAPMDRKPIVTGYAKTLEAMLKATKTKAVEDYKNGESA